MQTWNVTFTHLAASRLPMMTDWHITSRDNADLIAQIQNVATERGFGELIVDDFSDEIHFYFVRNNHRRRFLNVQFEG